MKKKLAILILSVIFALSMGIFLVAGCNGCNEEPSYTSYKVEFIAADHVSYQSVDLGEAAVPSGEITVDGGLEIKFKVSVENGYTQNPKVLANGNALSARNGEYSYKVESDTKITVDGVTETEYVLSGTGKQDNPYLISNVKDLLFMAKKINEGTNVGYIQGYYKLTQDIDCGGATLEVIGNGATVNSFFGGYFDGDGHTISNYKIISQGYYYAGLFGYVQASGTGDDLGTIINLDLKDFEIEAYAAEGRAVFAGSFYGFGIAARLIACSAVDGIITVYGNSYFCYAGGAVGIQQSAIIENDGIYPFYSVINYVNTQVDIYCEGYILAAGGITGYLESAHEFAPAIISNSYATGNVYSAIRAGGIVGHLGDYSSVTNCYSTGIIQANVTGNNDSHDYDALAGGIVGLAGVDTVIANSFSTAEIEAESKLGESYQKTGEIVAKHDAASDTADSVLVSNCYSGAQANPTNANFVKNGLKWKEADWTIKDGSLPVINRGETVESISINFTLNYCTQQIDGNSTKVVSVKMEQNFYAPMADYFLYGNLSEALRADNGYTSYGYYLDSALTQRVPYGYVSVGDITLYVAFADYSEVSGTYYYEYGGRTLEVELDLDGNFNYIDGLRYSSSYRYDGNNIIFNDALFARLSNIIIDDAPNDNYEAYRFVGVPSDGSIKVYDGTYFTGETSLVLTKVKPEVTGDEFKGVWEKSATVNKKYTFDGAGNWSYSYKGEAVASGTYTVAGGTATLLKDGQAYATAKIDGSGLLLLNDEYFCLEGSMFGIWFSNDGTGNYVRFDGYGGDLYGSVVVSIGSTYYELSYIKDGFFGENSMTLLSGHSLFGHLDYDTTANVLSGVLYNSSLGGFADGYVFYLVDDYSGEWIGNDSINGVDFKLLNFNGLGIYEAVDGGVSNTLGYIEINGERIPYTSDIENGLEGLFEYKGVTYTLLYDDITRTVTVKNSEGEVNLVRKDELFSYTLVTPDNRTIIKFNGGGNLPDGGILTVESNNGNASQFSYKINKCDLSNRILDVKIFKEGTESGYLTISGNKFRYVNGGEDKLLEIRAPFTGIWSVGNNMWSNFTIGNFDLSYTASGRFWDMDSNATYHWNYDANYVSVSYIGGEMTTSTTIYILYLQEDNVVLSTYPYLVPNGLNYYACKSDELAGTWYNAADVTGLSTLTFDGLADSKYTNGIAFDGVTTYLYTRRFGKIYMWDVTDESVMYVLETVSYMIKDEDVYNDGGRNAIRLVPFNAETTPVMTATDKDGVVYEIFLDGTLNVGTVNGSYQLVDVAGDITTMLVKINGEEMTVEIDHKQKTAKVLY